ncbi:MAG: alpha/beta hydrolase-fold protein [Bacteroidales bacterium]
MVIIYKRVVIIFLGLFFIANLSEGCKHEESERMFNMKNVVSDYVIPRNVDVWLPPSYYSTKNKRFPVLYMHDGQNLFDTATATWGITWGIAEWVEKLSGQGKIPEVIIVGMWCTPKRYLEYMPNKPFNLLSNELQTTLIDEYGGNPLGDEYLKFIVEELKPEIDKTYKTLPDQANTFIMGSSMGGLISSYAITEYPEVFGGAACLSTHWIGSTKNGGHEVSNALVKYLTENLPSPDNHKYYFDFGTKALDSLYKPHQLKIDSVMHKAGYLQGENWMTQKFEGAEHNEYFWQKRLDIPLVFLLNN